MSLFDQLAGAAGPEVPTCSRRGCRAPAAWRLLWNNPRLHAPDRRKTWLACPAHRDWLQDYLVQRGLWKETLPLEPASGAAANTKES
ncbi:hypothetical protein NCCP1664_05450 [Zafaria cholistanensis]|uniref:Acetone carboxylase n=1 Tax=Zafaria cholistanensis TaxID=1682741 RepID=A0A5A7NQD2_9MICC|nr:hypothetical protein [Zafaria cholistanensis]GER22048.1 hypothetical protein NCCP1664_05450 [Zafaria cholistanensis]